jgi:hypothetical protein
MYITLDATRAPPVPLLAGSTGAPLDRNPLADPRVRHALSLAIDRRMLVDRVMEGSALASGQFMPPGSFSALPELPVPAADAATARRLLGDRAILVAIGCYCLLGMGALVTNELQPLYLLLPVTSGGFGWGSSEIGLVSATAGPPLILFQLFVYDRLVTRWGLLPVARWSFAVTTLCVLVQPWCSLALQLPERLHQPGVAAHFSVLAVSRISTFTSVFVFVANAALPIDRGRVNGLSQSLVSAARALGPPLFTPLFAWAVENKMRYPLDLNLPFLLLSSLTAATLWLTYALPPWIVRKRATM